MMADPGHPPTFMPVDCRFQTYPWMDPNDPNYKEYNGNDGKGRLNYLLYLEMTGNSDGTTPEVKKEGRFLEHGGNWTDGTQPGKDAGSKFGTYVKSRYSPLINSWFEFWGRLNTKGAPRFPQCFFPPSAACPNNIAFEEETVTNILFACYVVTC